MSQVNYNKAESRFSNQVLEAYVSAKLPTKFEITALADSHEIMLYDEIGVYGVTSKKFIDSLKSIGDGPITLRINSPGGDVFDAMAIYNSLQSHKAPVNVIVDGLAASAASLIAMAGNTTTMHQHSMMMIHNSHTLSLGDRHEMQSIAAILEKVDNQLADIYASKTGSSAADMHAIMDKETWLTSTEALAQGFANAVLPETKPKAISEIGIQAVYDPDGDGDDDVLEAIGSINGAMDCLNDAIAVLTGTDDPEDTADMSMQMANEKAIRARRLRIATTD